MIRDIIMDNIQQIAAIDLQKKQHINKQVIYSSSDSELYNFINILNFYYNLIISSIEITTFP